MKFKVEIELTETSKQIVYAHVMAENKEQVKKMLSEESIFDVGAVYDEDARDCLDLKERVLSITEKEE